MKNQDIFQGNPEKHTDSEKNLFGQYGKYFTESPLPNELKLLNFPKYIRRQDISRFLAKNELVKMQLDVPGVIIECGCYAGGGLLTYAQLSSIYEPYNHQRKIYSFDTFSGFPALNEKDEHSGSNWSEGDLNVDNRIVEEINRAISLHDSNRALSHIEKSILIRGDAKVTVPSFIDENPHILVSMLYLDFDLYEPTLVSLKSFIPRMPKGSVLAFDELNTKNFPGETLALMEVIGVPNLKLKKTMFDPYISYAIVE